MLKVTYFFIKRRYRKSSVVDKNSAKENNIYTNSENVYNESSSESLNLENEKVSTYFIIKKVIFNFFIVLINM